MTAALDLLLICLIEVSLHNKLKVTLWYVQAWKCVNVCVCVRVCGVYVCAHQDFSLPIERLLHSILGTQTNPTPLQRFITPKQKAPPVTSQAHLL